MREEAAPGTVAHLPEGAGKDDLAVLLTRVVSEEKSLMFIRPKKYIVSSGSEPPELGYVDIRSLADSVCRYDLNDMDAAWLELTNEEFKEMGESTRVVVSSPYAETHPE